MIPEAIAKGRQRNQWKSVKSVVTISLNLDSRFLRLRSGQVRGNDKVKPAVKRWDEIASPRFRGGRNDPP